MVYPIAVVFVAFEGIKLNIALLALMLLDRVYRGTFVVYTTGIKVYTGRVGAIGGIKLKFARSRRVIGIGIGIVATDKVIINPSRVKDKISNSESS